MYLRIQQQVIALGRAQDTFWKITAEVPAPRCLISSIGWYWTRHRFPRVKRFLKLWQLLKLWQPHIYTYIYIYHNIQHIYTRNKESTAAFSEAAVSIYSIGRVTDSHTSMLCETSPPSNLYNTAYVWLHGENISKKRYLTYIYIYWLFEVWCRSEMYWKPKTYADQQRQCSLFVDVDAKVQPTLAKHLKNNYSIYTNIYKHIYIYSLYINIYIYI